MAEPQPKVLKQGVDNPAGGLVDADLHLHDVPAGGRADEAGANIGVVLVERPHVVRVAVVVHHPLVAPPPRRHRPQRRRAGGGVSRAGPLLLLGTLAFLLVVVVAGGGVFGLALLAMALVEGVFGAREGEAHALSAAALAGLADDGGDAHGDGVLAAAHPLPAHLPATAGPRRRTRAKTRGRPAARFVW